MTTAPTVDPATLIEDVIRDFVERSPENTLQGLFEEKAFETPLVGFSSGDDPLYDSYKQVVGPFHWTPLEIFTQTFPGIRVKLGPGAYLRRRGQCQAAQAGCGCFAKSGL